MTLTRFFKEQFDQRDEMVQELTSVLYQVYRPLILMAIKGLKRRSEEPNYFGRFYSESRIWDSLEKLSVAEASRASRTEFKQMIRLMHENAELSGMFDVSGRGYFNLPGA